MTVQRNVSIVTFVKNYVITSLTRAVIEVWHGCSNHSDVYRAIYSDIFIRRGGKIWTTCICCQWIWPNTGCGDMPWWTLLRACRPLFFDFWLSSNISSFCFHKFALVNAIYIFVSCDFIHALDWLMNLVIGIYVVTNLGMPCMVNKCFYMFFALTRISLYDIFHLDFYS